MKTYTTILDVIFDRKKGATLAQIQDFMITAPELWKQYGDSPFFAIDEIRDTDYLDTTTEVWKNLPVESQNLYALFYQEWYANLKSLPDYEIVIHEGTELMLTLIPPVKLDIGPSNLELTEGQTPYRKTILQKKPFWMGKAPVTQAQWKSVMGTNPSWFKNDESPVECVNLEDAKEFCRITKTDLPTSEEWETACRAGTTSIYYFGNNPTKLREAAWYAENSDNTTHRIGQKIPNAWNLYDMYGNVSEWCKNKYAPDNRYQETRGGSFRNLISECTSASQGKTSSTRRVLNIGFRVCMPFKSL